MVSRQSTAWQFARSAPPGVQLRPEGRQGSSGIARSEGARCFAPPRQQHGPCDQPGGCHPRMLRRWCLSMERPPFRSRWTCLRPKDRRDRRLQGRSADLRAGRVRQAVELVDAHGAFFISVTHAFNTTMNGAADAHEVASARNGAGPSLQSNANARSSSRADSLKSFKGSMP